MSNYYSILSAVQSSIQGLGLLFNSQAVGVVVRKLPKAEESLDRLPLICVVPSATPEKVTRTFEGQQLVDYRVQVVIIAAGNHDFTSNMDVWLTWRQQIRALFKVPPLTGVASVWRTQANPDTPIDRGALNASYDYLSTTFVFGNVE